MQWPAPKNVKKLRVFLGLTGYYRRFVKGYGMFARPLTELLRKNKFVWSSEAQLAFDKLKHTMSTVPVLALPSFAKVLWYKKIFRGLVWVLCSCKINVRLRSSVMDWQQGNKLNLFMSGNLWLLCCLVKNGSTTFWVADLQFIQIKKSLKFLFEQHEVTLDYQKWLIKLFPYDFEILYKQGIDNKADDGLSRIQHPIQSVCATQLLTLTVPTVLKLKDLYK